jgi:hypothetical protein
MEELNKDHHHTRQHELIVAASQLFANEQRESSALYDKFARHAFTFPSGHVRLAKGSNIRQLIHPSQKRPIHFSDETIQDMSATITNKNMYRIIEEMVSTNEGRMQFVKWFPYETLQSFDNDQLTAVSKNVLRDLYKSADSPETKAEIIVYGLGKQQTLAGIKSMQMNDVRTKMSTN